jgi:RapA N-terminal Tudor like domain 1/RapA N-terminal Tudor like domain
MNDPAALTWTRGQRWVSDGEPELGLGIVRNHEEGRVKIEFPAASETRMYATETAPLRRVKFLPGDLIKIQSGLEMEVDAVCEQAGLVTYLTTQGEIAETELSDSISFSKPEERLYGGKLDAPADFDLRGEALHRRAGTRRRSDGFNPTPTLHRRRSGESSPAPRLTRRSGRLGENDRSMPHFTPIDPDRAGGEGANFSPRAIDSSVVRRIVASLPAFL